MSQESGLFLFRVRADRYSNDFRCQTLNFTVYNKPIRHESVHVLLS